MNELRKYAWSQFAASALQITRNPGPAAVTADKMMDEFDKRFGSCALCFGKGWIKGTDGDCPQCHGSGDVRSR